MQTTSDVYILIKTQPHRIKSVALELKTQGFEVRTTGYNSPYNIIIFFDAKHTRSTDLYWSISSMTGVIEVCIIPAFLI